MYKVGSISKINSDDSTSDTTHNIAKSRIDGRAIVFIPFFICATSAKKGEGDLTLKKSIDAQ